ncbi:unnamed protein product [Adineta ricciae]|uniref:Peptidase C1A papain C-terminal domain-containing protein n=1 Tax=Adineta ricciae TaxID=249248 RepID=A0A815QV47_ADIRI|nr:unnamed protein product [Adineta ricciae]
MWTPYYFERRRYYHAQRDGAHTQEESFSFPNQRLAPSVDLRMWMTPITNQNNTRTCCANAFAAICEYLIRRTNNRPFTQTSIILSHLFIYFNGRMKEQHTRHVRDLGVFQRSVALGIREYGACEEEFWSSRWHSLREQPHRTAYQQARKYTAVLLRVPITIEAIETCLHNQIPVPIDIIMDDETVQIITTNNGFLDVRRLNDNTIDVRNLHTVLIVGYDRRKQHFIMRNSWGTNWGSDGYFYVPYSFLSRRERINCTDTLWTIRRIEPRKHRLPNISRLVLQ